MKVFTAEQMRAFDHEATEKYNIPSIVLMENAALRVVEFLEMKFAPLRGKRITVLCGKGNNGGDGFAIARHLINAKAFVQVALLCNPDELKGDAKTNFEALNTAFTDGSLPVAYSIEGQLCRIDDNLRVHALPDHGGYPDLILDAVLGTGFRGELNQYIGHNLTDINLLGHAPRIAIDIPSALNADTGENSSDAPACDYTVTFAAPKRGMFLRDGPHQCGEVWIGDIGTLPSQMMGTKTNCECITHEKAQRLLPYRSIDAHKGDAGRVVVCGGSYGMSGAPTLAAKAVLRSGAGLCIACVPDKVLPMFAAAFSEATSHPLACDEEGHLTEAAADAMAKHWESAHAVALGPGLSRADAALNFARRVVRECPHPLIIDADALYALRAIEMEVKGRGAPTILTPHPGEMGELMEMETKDVQNDRIGVAVECAQRYNAIVVLKGARSIVALPDGYSYINLTGNSGMATGGSGDVLTGTITGLLAQLKNAEHATLLGVYLHGRAGDLAYAEKGNGLIAGDIAEALPQAILKVQEPPDSSPNGRLRRLQ